MTSLCFIELTEIMRNDSKYRGRSAISPVAGCAIQTQELFHVIWKPRQKVIKSVEVLAASLTLYHTRFLQKVVKNFRCWIGRRTIMSIYFFSKTMFNEIRLYVWLITSIMSWIRDVPEDTRRWINVGLPLVQRRRRWTNGKSKLIQRLVSAGIAFPW